MNEYDVSFMADWNMLILSQNERSCIRFRNTFKKTEVRKLLKEIGFQYHRRVHGIFLLEHWKEIQDLFYQEKLKATL